MKQFLVICLLVGLCAASDLACTRNGGTCLDYRYYLCTAGYEQGLCDGDSNRRCCQDCDNTCLSTENGYVSCCDSQCTQSGGKCQDNTNYCSGSYSSGMCGGPSARQCCSAASSGGAFGCYGNIYNTDTTGASCATSSQDNLGYCGISASRQLAATDLNRMSQYKDEIEQASYQLCMDAAVIAGIISRESRAGAALNSNGYGGDGHGYGLMQVDDRYHTIEGGPTSLDHILQGTSILISNIGQISSKFPSWDQNMDLKGGICAYNIGVGGVWSYDNMDVGTTGDDYSSDVVARAQYYEDNGY
ncbi:lysozyme g [Ciona intestinalis]